MVREWDDIYTLCLLQVFPEVRWFGWYVFLGVQKIQLTRFVWSRLGLPPWRLTWNLRIHPGKRKIIFPTIIFRFELSIFGGVGKMGSTWSGMMDVFCMHTICFWKMRYLFPEPARWVFVLQLTTHVSQKKSHLVRVVKRYQWATMMAVVKEPWLVTCSTQTNSCSFTIRSGWKMVIPFSLAQH